MVLVEVEVEIKVGAMADDFKLPLEAAHVLTTHIATPSGPPPQRCFRLWGVVVVAIPTQLIDTSALRFPVVPDGPAREELPFWIEVGSRAVILAGP
jgi:hypothetical protein